MNALRIPRAERDRLVERLQGAHMPPIPAVPTGLDVVDCTGIQRGNSDIACERTPYAGPRDFAPLPGHEHDKESPR